MPEKVGGNHKNLKNKAVYYICDLHSGQSGIGKPYDELARTVQITFCAYTVFPHKTSFVHDFSLRDEDGEKLTDAISTVFIELSKLEQILIKPVVLMTSLEMWSVFFRYADDPVQRDVINEIIEVKEEIDMASTLLASISQDDRERAIQMSRRKYQTDLESGRLTIFREGKLEGVREGKLEGIREGKLEAAKKMKLANIPTEQIVEFTGLSEKEIAEI